MYESTSQGWIKEYDLEKRDMIEGIYNHKKSVNSMVCTSNSKLLFSCCKSEKVVVWDKDLRSVSKT